MKSLKKYILVKKINSSQTPRFCHADIEYKVYFEIVLVPLIDLKSPKKIGKKCKSC